mmetsp:Transcript_25194/g.31635  ORF Transcript_25194/g.31635 Transcript_25194/m.31635 type:complete len:109 (+) Transcript_25194:432-758(+)
MSVRDMIRNFKGVGKVTAHRMLMYNETYRNVTSIDQLVLALQTGPCLNPHKIYMILISTQNFLNNQRMLRQRVRRQPNSTTSQQAARRDTTTLQSIFTGVTLSGEQHS